MSIVFSPVLNPPADAECAICQNTSEENVWVKHEAETSQVDLKVQHQFHTKCLKGALETSRTCPLCKKEVSIVNLFTEDELNAFTSNEAKRIRAREQAFIDVGHLVGLVASSTFLFCQGAFEHMSGRSVQGTVSCIANAILTGYLFGRNFDHPQNAIISLNAGFFALANSAFALGIHTFLSPENQLQSNIIAATVSMIAVLKLGQYFSPTRINVTMGDQDRSAFVRFNFTGGSSLLLIGSLLARNAWTYYHS